MKCPFCNSPDTQVKDSRIADDGSHIKRRRSCEVCGSKFNTIERPIIREMLVKKSSGTVVPFEREKLERSIVVASKKRPIPPERIDKIVSSIQRQLESGGEAEVSTSEIARLALDALAAVDRVAYIRFASV
ncbi:MAG: transcriptional regulator NrdR, partial [Rickettsiales bacterium]|nr:transcriptional regulator NrdR [Rickettsiales bacterium]